jgi:pyrimidine-specific ribonucleoside hydrolase
LLALGPLTNVAQALLAEPGLAVRLGSLTVMGGAVGVPGNVALTPGGPSNVAAEWNIYCDPRAAAIVLRSGVPVSLVALDATNHAPITLAFYERLAADRTTAAAEFAYQALSQTQDFMASGGYYFWDPLAAAILVDGSLAAFQEYRLEVVEEEGPDSGRTLASPSGHPVRVAVSADRERFEALFLDTLNGRLG